MTAFVPAVHGELENYIPALSLPLKSVFLGGGTPTALGAKGLRELLEPIKALIDADTEYSIEANPGVFDEAIAEILRRCGVNRVNFGVQSFDAEELAMLGRIHSADEARRALCIAKDAGFDNIGLDLIYGIPGQGMDSWRRSLQQAVEAGVEHLSCYALSFEDGTPLGDDLAAGRVIQMGDDLQKELYLQAVQDAAAAGLKHYEISNFARQGKRCLHNLTYWNNLTYLGLGPGAASYCNGVRRVNDTDLGLYLEALHKGLESPCSQEQPSSRTAMAETVMLGLRQIEGLSKETFRTRFGLSILEAFPRSVPRYISQGAIVDTGTHIRFVEQALFASDTILADVIAEA